MDTRIVPLQEHSQTCAEKMGKCLKRNVFQK